VTRAAALLRRIAVATTLLAQAVAAADVDVQVVSMGVGAHVRPGDPTGMLVRLTSGLTAPVQARVEWVLRNADGDLVRNWTDVALAPGAPADRWVYGVPPIVSSSAAGCLEAISALRVVEIEDGAVVRVLAERRIDGRSGEDPAVPVETNQALVGVVGDGRAGLSALSIPTPNMGANAAMNEMTMVARGIQASRLPDRWEGLSSFETIIWTNAPVQNLGVEQGRALLDWVRRGGNLVIVLPESGDPWGLSAGRGRTPLADALPQRATRHDGVPVADLLPVLARTGTLRNASARTGAWTFPADPGNGFAPILLLPAQVDPRTGNVVTAEGSLAGEAVAVRRPMGFGFVTVVGIDVDGLDRRALVAEGLPQADIFWNRLLGRRADAPTSNEWNALAEAKRLESRAPLTVGGNGGDLVNHFVGMQSRAAIGVLGLLGAFAAYWLLAGPGSFMALRRMGRVQLAWLAYVAVAAVAATMAWLVTGAMELTSGRVQHLTFLDRVEDPAATADDRAAMRATGWISAALPGYGITPVALERSDLAAGSDLLWSWFAPPLGSQGGFPDTESYEVPARSPASYGLPSRATSTVLAAHWMGRPNPAWDGTPRPLAGRPLRQDITWGASPRIILHGTLAHALPAALTEVMIVHVSPFRPPDRTTGAAVPEIKPSDQLPSIARMARLARWEPNAPLDVAAALYGNESGTAEPSPARAPGQAGAERALYARYYQPVLESSVASFDPNAALTKDQVIEMLQLYGMLQPPAYLLDAPDGQRGWRSSAVRVDRDLGRGADLSRWWSQPCLLVIGRIDDAGNAGIGMPFPFRIDGKEPRADGTTWVRVAFPLPAVRGAMIPPK